MQSRNPYDKKNEIYGAQTLHREIGYNISRLEQYQKSLKFFDAAIKETPEDRRALMGRARARAKASQYEGALEDINHALSFDPDDLTVLGDKALTTYLCNEFEEGLVQNTRLIPRRKKPETFMMGIMHCTDAIENCVGDRAGRPLRDHFKIIRRLAWKRNYETQKPFEPTPKGKPKKKKKEKHGILKLIEIENATAEPVQPKQTKTKSFSPGGIRDTLDSAQLSQERIPPFNQPFPFKPLQHYTSNIENFMAEKYLDAMYLDKIFLKDFQTASGVVNPNNKGSTRMKQIAKNCYKSVYCKQEVLRSRRPFYFIKYQEARVSGALKERQQMELEHQQLMNQKEANVIMDKMMQAFRDKRTRDCLALVEKLKRFCDGKSRKLFPNKSNYMTAIHETVCNVFYDTYRLNPNHSMFLQNRRIYATLGISLSREPSTDSVVREFAYVFLDSKKQIAMFEQRLKNAVISEEICWFYHELARLHIELNSFDLARVYSRKCIQEATAINNEKWILNCAMQMCKTNVMQHNKNDARNDLQIALKSAQKLNDKDKIKYIEQCLEVIENYEFEDMGGLKELQKREKMIIKMMHSSKMKEEVSHLFRQMAAMPNSRRMTVIPGVNTDKQEGKQMKGRAMSILPGSRAATRESMGELKKSAGKPSQGGVELMDLIDINL